VKESLTTHHATLSYPVCSMATLSLASPPPPCGSWTTCERNCEYHYQLNDEKSYPQPIHSLTGYPNVVVESHLSSVQSSSVSAFLPQEETQWQRAWREWKASGLSGALEQLTEGDEETWVSSISGYLLSMVHLFGSLHGWMYPHLKLSSDDMIAEFCQTSDWFSAVRAIDWHPIMSKLAVGGNDDVVRVFCLSTEAWPQLKHKLQRHIVCLAWRPLTQNTLAVGCKSGVAVWEVDPQVARPSSSAMQHLTYSGYGPITSLSWSPTGHLLAAASPAHTTIMIWAVSSERVVPLYRYGGGGIPFVLWSPDGSHLMSSTVSKFFRVWETQMWTCEKYTNLSNRCQAACWSPDGQALVFAVRGEPCLYSLLFTGQSGDMYSSRPSVGSQVCVKCVDLVPVTFQTQRGDVIVGGNVQSLQWDPKGERLAVLCTSKVHFI
jgi:aladin